MLPGLVVACVGSFEWLLRLITFRSKWQLRWCRLIYCCRVCLYLAYDGVHDDCEPFFFIGGEQEVGQFLLDLVDVFEVGDACNVLSFIRVNFVLGHAIISRGVSRMY